MAKVEHRKANKDYPEHGIKKGDMYYFVSLKTGPRSSRTLRQIAPFKRSQLTTSNFLSQLYAWEEAKELVASPGELQDLADTIRELGEETQGSFDNMPEGLQQGDTGQMLEERANACSEAADEIEQILSDWTEAVDAYNDEKSNYDEEYAEWEVAQAAFDALTDEEQDAAAADMPNEPDEPDEVDNDDFISRVADVSVDV